MKNTITILAILLLSFNFNSCNKLKELADVKFGTTLVEKIPVHFNENQSEEAIDQTLVMSLDNIDTHDYLDKIKDVSISKLTYRIVNLTGGDESTYMQVNLLMDAFELQHNLETNILADYNDGTIFEVTDVDKLNQVANAIKANKQITAKLSGNYQSQAATDFDIEVTIELNLVANPL